MNPHNRQEKLSSNDFSFIIANHPVSGLNIDLIRASTGESKHFFIANGIKERIEDAMNSLTDSLCEQFTTVKKPKQKKVKSE